MCSSKRNVNFLKETFKNGLILEGKSSISFVPGALTVVGALLVSWDP